MLRVLLFTGLVCLTAAGVRADENGTAAGNRLAPKAFRASVEKVLPCVVSIEAFGGLATGGAKSGGLVTGDGPTTGVIISPDGYIVTSTFNFVRQPPIITVVLRDGHRHVAKLLGRDETRKLCLLKIEGVENLPTPRFTPRNEIAVGQWAVAVGVGYSAAEPALSVGIVSAASRLGERAIQTDANTSPVNYGGPLVDLSGRVLGICVPLSPGSGEVGAGVEWYDSGIGFAVSLADQEKLLTALKEGKTIRPAFLGIQLGPADAEREGAVINEVVPKSPAEKAGLKKGDRIVAIDDVAVIDPVHLKSLLSKFVAGEKAKVAYEREGKTAELELELAAPPPEQKPEQKPAPKPKNEG